MFSTEIAAESHEQLTCIQASRQQTTASAVQNHLVLSRRQINMFCQYIYMWMYVTPAADLTMSITLSPRQSGIEKTNSDRTGRHPHACELQSLVENATAALSQHVSTLTV